MRRLAYIRSITVGLVLVVAIVLYLGIQMGSASRGARNADIDVLLAPGSDADK